MDKRSIEAKKAFKKAFGPESTKKLIKACEKAIENKALREDIVSFIKAADGKKIRNTSGV